MYKGAIMTARTTAHLVSEIDDRYFELIDAIGEDGARLYHESQVAAINRIEAICRDLHCSKSWLYKWKARYQADDPTWAKGLSTQPRHKPSQVPLRIEQRVVELRRTLVQRGQHGSVASIQQELEQQGIKPIPSLRTIYRMLQRHNQEDI